MTNLYRHELDIPEKSKTVGWLFLLMGLILLCISLFIFHQERIEFGRELIVKNTNPTTTSPAPSKFTKDVAMLKERVRPYVLWVGAAIFLLAMFILIVTFSHRFAVHLRSGRKEISKTTITDPWQESGKRFRE
jgi:hypothetical protein